MLIIDHAMKTGTDILIVFYRCGGRYDDEWPR